MGVLFWIGGFLIGDGGSCGVLSLVGVRGFLYWFFRFCGWGFVVFWLVFFFGVGVCIVVCIVGGFFVLLVIIFCFCLFFVVVVMLVFCVFDVIVFVFIVLVLSGGFDMFYVLINLF